MKFIQYFLIVNLNLACWCPICSGTARNTLSQPSIWLTIGLTSILCILPVIAYRFLLILLRPTINDKVITDRRLNGFDRGQREGRAGSVDTKNYDGNQVLPLAARLNLCPVLRLVWKRCQTCSACLPWHTASSRLRLLSAFGLCLPCFANTVTDVLSLRNTTRRSWLLFLFLILHSRNTQDWEKKTPTKTNIKTNKSSTTMKDFCWGAAGGMNTVPLKTTFKQQNKK